MKRDRKNISGLQIARVRRHCHPIVTQLELSRRVGRLGVSLDRAAIAKIENGLRGVLDYELVALARALRVGTGRLLAGGSRRAPYRESGG